MKRIVFCLFMLGCLFPFQAVLAADAPDTTSYPVLSRGHIQDVGDFPLDGTWVSSPNRIGTVGESKRIEGFEIKPGDDLPDGIQIRYNVHVQNDGWLYDENDVTSWAKDGEFAGTRARSLRIEAIKIVLTDTSGNQLTDYHIKYRGHIENLGNTPADENQWFQDGEKLGTVGSSLRLEALKLEISKDAPKAKTYDQAGTYGPATGTETIVQDVVIVTDGVTLQNLTVNGNLTIDEAVGDGNVTLNNVTVTGETRVRGGGVNSIHINGGKYGKILVEKTPTGQVRIVTTDLNGARVVLSEAAKGEILILEGAFDSVAVFSPDVTVETRGQTNIQELTVSPAASNSTMNLGSQTTVAELSVQAPAHISGSGTVQKAAVDSDSVVFDKAPGSCTVDPGVNIPPVIPAPPAPPSGGGGYTPPSKISLSVATAPTVILSKTYDGTTATNVTAKAVDGTTVTGIVSGDDVTVVATATYDNKKAETDKTITITYSLSGTNAGKYNPPAATTVKGEIVKKTLSLPATPSVSKTFDGTTTLDTVINEDLGQVASDSLTIIQTATYQNSAGKTDAIEVGSGKTVACTYSLSGTDAGNYTVPAAQPGTGTITKRPLSVSAASLNINKTKTYDGTTNVYNSAGNIITSGNNVIQVETGVAGDASETSISVTATAAYDNPNASSGKSIMVNYSISGNANSRYQVTPTETISGASITACQLTIPVADVPQPVAKSYDGTADVFTAGNNTDKIYNKPVTPDNIAVADTGKVTVKATATYDAGKDVGTGKKITIHYALSEDGASNYLAPPDDHSKIADITPLTITTTATVKNKEYDGSNKADVGVGFTDQLALDAIKNKTMAFDTTAVYKDANGSETFTAGDNYTVDYSYKLSGTDAGNFKLKDADASNVISGTKTNCSITAKKLTVSVAALGLQTTKTYDGKTSVKTNISTITGNSGLTGIVGDEKVTATVSSYYNGADAGPHEINTSFALSGANSANYKMDDMKASGTIKPLQLTIAAADVPAVDATKMYDGTTATNVTNKDVPVIGVIDGEAVAVTATATYNDKNASTAKTITITYSLPADTKNYLAPVADTSQKATITARKLGYTSVNLETIKKQDGKSSAVITAAKADTTTASGDGVIHVGSSSTQEDVSLASYSADYCENNLADTTSATGQHPIVITGTLTGNDAGNYVMAAYQTPGEIVPKNAVVTANYDEINKLWGPWSYIDKTLTPPNSDSGFKLFYKDTTKLYGLGSDGKIYQSSDLNSWTSDLNSWTQYIGGGVLVDDDLSSSTCQLIGLDITGTPQAVDSSGNIYYWNSSWTEYGSGSLTSNVTPINPTLYSDISDTYYLIYQDSVGQVWKSDFSGKATAITDSQKARLVPLSSFTNLLLTYDGNAPTVYAY